MSEDPKDAKEEDARPVIAIIGTGHLSCEHAAILDKFAEVVILDSLEELVEFANSPEIETRTLDEMVAIVQPEIPTTHSIRKYRSGKGKGRGAADWNKRNRGY